ncbi:MAG: DUF1499 domain-containing protein [Betaproteobacteria bacterium]
MAHTLARGLLLLIILCAIVVGVSGPGYRYGWWPLPLAFQLLRWPAYVAIGAMIVSLITAIMTRPGTSQRGFDPALAALVIGAAIIVGPIMMMARASAVPPIHDISTDMDNPPAFVAVLARRSGAANPATYGGPDIAALQKKAFPQIAPLELAVKPDLAYALALAQVKDNGWEVVAASAAENRIEATATTPFFGFKDDIVLRITAHGSGSRVDMRSVSRIGRSDIGTNARRIEAFLGKLAAAR